MPKFLYKANYTKAGLEGLLREGGSSRAKAIQMVAESMGGTVESMYWAFGETDVYLICDLPDAVAAGAVSALRFFSGFSPLAEPSFASAAASLALASSHSIGTSPVTPWSVIEPVTLPPASVFSSIVTFWSPAGAGRRPLSWVTRCS